MKIGIFGEHPDLHPGFSGAMAQTQLKAFADEGHSVTLYLPDTADDGIDAKLAKLGLSDVEMVRRFGIDFDIVPVSHPDQFQKDLDFLIWQTYKPFHQPLWPAKRSFHISKSVPRFAANRTERYRKKALGQLSHFDSLALALRVDFEILSDLVPELSHRFAHVPRGFCPEWLPPDRKPTDRLVLACDAAVKAEDGGHAALAHVKHLIRELTSSDVPIEARATRGAATVLSADERINSLPLWEFYTAFMLPSMIYLPCDFDFSIHSKNIDKDDSGNAVYIGMYENQIVEMQMAGAIPIVQVGHCDSEIVFDTSVCFIESYNDEVALLNHVKSIQEDFVNLSRQAHEFAIQNHSITTMAQKWTTLIERT